MGLASEVLQFFNVGNSPRDSNGITPYSIRDFWDIKGGNPFDVRLVCQKLENEGLLIRSGTSTSDPITGTYFYNIKLDKQLLEYGSYDFLVEGFLSIRNHFSSSVRPVIVRDKAGNDDIGSCFVISENILITARHCIESMESIRIPGPNGGFVKATQILMPVDERKDIAVIVLENTPFAGNPHFIFDNGAVLEQVLTMGYPPISGFDSIQFAETATINSHIKASTGDIVGEDKSYLDRQNYLLVNARVKGGNSGGPIINKHGMVVGMLVNIPTDPQDGKKLDVLGYGVAIPASELTKVLESMRVENSENANLPFENLEIGFKTNL